MKKRRRKRVRRRREKRRRQEDGVTSFEMAPEKGQVTPMLAKPGLDYTSQPVTHIQSLCHPEVSHTEV